MMPEAILVLTAFAVGYAMKYGGLCTYAAALQIVRERRVERLLAFLGAAAFTALVVVPLAWIWPRDLRISTTHEYWLLALTGGLMLGIGAWLNRGCVFGTFVQLTGGDMTYIATLIGMVAGAVGVRATLPHLTPAANLPPPAAQPGGWFIMAGLVAFITVLALAVDLRGGKRRPLRFLFIAMVLGIGGGGLFAAVSGWDFAAVLIRAGYNSWGLVPSGPTMTAVLTTLAMVAGGITAATGNNRFHWRLPRPRPALASLAGGALMGAASPLIPGGNDGLLLSGIPALAPHAWVGFLAMLTTMLAMLVIMPNDRGFKIGGKH